MEDYNRKRNKRIIAVVLVLALIAAALVLISRQSSINKEAPQEEQEKYVIAVAWHNNQESYSFVSTLRTIEAAGAEPVVLDQAISYDLKYDENGELISGEDRHGMLTRRAARLVKNNTWQNSNVEELMKGVNCIIFPGGSDISSSLYYSSQRWHGIKDDADYNAERDVSDYMLMSYCLEHDIPMLCICRGMQMLSIVSGADMIDDLGTWYKDQGIKYHDLHRDPEKKDLVPHDVTVLSRDSLLHKATGQDTLRGAPSWHHQAVGSVKDTRLIVTAETETDGLPVIEGVERPDKTFCAGVQFHPEVAVRKRLDKEENADDFMDYDTAISLFNALIEAGYKKK